MVITTIPWRAKPYGTRITKRDEIDEDRIASPERKAPKAWSNIATLGKMGSLTAAPFAAGQTMPNATATPRQREVKDRELLRRVNTLRKLDNFRNWFYISGEYLFLSTVIGLTIAFYHYRPIWD